MASIFLNMAWPVIRNTLLQVAQDVMVAIWREIRPRLIDWIIRCLTRIGKYLSGEEKEQLETELDRRFDDMREHPNRDYVDHPPDKELEEEMKDLKQYLDTVVAEAQRKLSQASGSR